MSRPLKTRIKERILRTGIGYRFFQLRLKDGVVGLPSRRPKAPCENCVLRSRSEWEAAVEEAKSLNLPVYRDLPKNWDSLAAVAAILARTEQNARILDAGADENSVILPWLYLYGYKDLLGINIAFERTFKRGPIVYQYGNIMDSMLPNESFDAVTCMSVIEHGVDIRRFFREMERILRPGGTLVVSTDYWEDKVDTNGEMAYDAPIKIFDRVEIIDTLEVAQSFGFSLTGDLELNCDEKTVYWAEYDLQYTFLIFSLTKKST